MTASESENATALPMSGRWTKADTYKAYHDWARSESLSHSVTEAVAVALDADLGELEPLYTAIDPDALDELFESVASTHRMQGAVSFTFNGCMVRVATTGKIVVQTLIGDAPN